MKIQKIAYWIVTGLLSAFMLFSASMYFFKYADVAAEFTALGFPTFIIYPLAVAKILGIIAIISKISKSLKEWAYAGFFFDFLLAAGGHIAVKDGEYLGAIVALVLLGISYFLDKRIFS